MANVVIDDAAMTLLQLKAGNGNPIDLAKTEYKEAWAALFQRKSNSLSKAEKIEFFETCRAEMAAIHAAQPSSLSPEVGLAWFDGKIAELKPKNELLKPLPHERLLLLAILHHFGIFEKMEVSNRKLASLFSEIFGMGKAHLIETMKPAKSPHLKAEIFKELAFLMRKHGVNADEVAKIEAVATGKEAAEKSLSKKKVASPN